jgi:hypothetical protein
MRLEMVMPRSLNTVWPLVREGLNEINRKTGSDDRVDMVKSALETNPRMRLYLVTERGAYSGFVITKIDENLDKRELCLYKGYSVPESKWKSEEFMVNIKKVARDFRCSSITLYSTRRGWRRKAKALGFAQGYTQYIMEV